jgi:hypothetical protein
LPPLRGGGSRLPARSNWGKVADAFRANFERRLALGAACEPERSVRPMTVVVPDVDTKETLEVTAAEDQEMVEAVGVHGSHLPLRIGVRVRRPHGRPDHPNALGAKHLVEAAARSLDSCLDTVDRTLTVQNPHG